MHSIGKLPFKVIAFTSEDSKFRANNLNYGFGDRLATADSYWLSNPNCQYPQSLVFSFEGLTHLTQIQLLCHEFCICTRVDLFVSERPAIEYQSALEDVQYTRLGHLSLDPNEKSLWQARELKSVFVTTDCCLLKLVFHEPHQNKLNAYNQVGIISVACMGEPIVLSPSHKSRISSTSSSVNLDIQTANLIFDLEKRRTDASSRSDLVAAKKLKDQIDALKVSGGLIASFEKDKQDAIRVEDFDMAKAIKAKIESIRKSQLEPGDKSGAFNVGNLRTSHLGADADSPSKKNALPTFGTMLGNDALPPPDPLPSFFERDYPQLIESLGEDVCARLVSRDWRLRDSGIEKVISKIRDKVDDPYGVSWIVRKLIADKIVNVFVKTCDLIQVVLQSDIDRANESGALSETMEFALIHLIEYRLGDSNKRTVDAAIATMTAVAKSGLVSSQTFSHYLLKPCVASSKAVSGRAQALAALIETFQFKGKKGLHLDSVVSTIGNWYSASPSRETRMVVAQTLRVCVRSVGMQKIETAVDALEPTIRENLLHELSRNTFILGSGRSTECDFCGESSRAFLDQDKLDLHYWEECPALIECKFCEQVIELTCLTEHRLKECERQKISDVDEL